MFPNVNLQRMNSENQSGEKKSGFSKKAIYRIEVEGVISADWSERIRGMEVRLMQGENNKPISILTGEVADQSALAGMLKTLFEFHLSVLSVRKLRDISDL